MAVPSDFSISKINGKFAVNKALSDTMDTMFRIQGFGWVTRKALGLASITAHITPSVQDNGVERIEVVPYISGGFKWSLDVRPLDLSEQQVSNPILGTMVYKSRKIKLSEVTKDDEYLKEGHSGSLKEGWDTSADDTLINSHVVGKGWVQDETWGLMDFNGKKHFTMRYRVINDAKEETDLKIVYDYTGAL
ncbi:hypothetical protein D9758_017880 [Tetrapyrgos nigripes]|uniref:Uncharacterized protein n=1 Tax=Tetrapyrgos nigripes TaxID=182062 RepID=A0A8H5F1T6_9AGAR|nr:hypothetical protein D9758_017880 [Tetrapyrgos nigripes]